MTTERKPPSRTATAGETALLRLILLMIAVFVCGVAWSVASEQPAAAEPALPGKAQTSPIKQFDDQIRPFLVKHCQECHGTDKPKGNFSVDKLSADFADGTNRERWQKVLKRVRTGEMPPKAKPRPPENEARALFDWIGDRTVAAAAARRTAEGRVVLRRLNRIEYENTVRDLLGVEVSLKDQLPQDGSAEGFDNVGAALHTSSFLMERYLDAADTALNLATANQSRPPTIKKRFSLADTRQVKTSKQSVYRKGDEAVVCFSSSDWNAVGLTPFSIAERGNYRFLISASAVQSSDKPVTFAVTAGGRRRAGKGGLVGYFDAPAGRPAVIEFVEFMEPQTTVSLLPYGLAGARTISEVGADKWQGPGLAVQWVEVEGPLHETWPPASHRRLFGDLAQGSAPIPNSRNRIEVVSKGPEADAERILRVFIRRAFRRAISDDDVKPYLALVKAKLAEKYTFEQAVRAAFLGVMVSPQFLFFSEQPGPLDDFALASRLSYFLWSSMPDDELLQLAEEKKLSQPDTLRQQVERLLKHPKAAAFTENFVGQWLSLRDIDFTMPSNLLYPEFDHMLKVSMIRETELFFAEVLKDDLSLTNFVASDFTMLNGRLARHYGIPGVDGWDFRKVTLPKDSHRGGVMTMASVLKVTANGTYTQPVTRGVFVLERILGTAPPPPPADVPSLVPDIRGAVTIRQQLAKHRQEPSCAACHAKIDPPGFALENFDVIGGWRENYRTRGNGPAVMVEGRRMNYSKGAKVDPADVMADGQRFSNIDEFKLLLLKDKDQLARGLTEKLLTYATGEPPDAADKSAIETIVLNTRDQSYGFRTLIHEIVQSKVFQSK